jgi:hypothetical protein
VVELLHLVQTIHPRCWRVHGYPCTGRGAVTLPPHGPTKA